MKKALVIRFIEKEMSMCMRLAAFDYRRGNYSDAHEYVERACALGDIRKLVREGRYDDIKKYEREMSSIENAWISYWKVAKELDEVDVFIKTNGFDR